MFHLCSIPLAQDNSAKGSPTKNEVVRAKFFNYKLASCEGRTTEAHLDIKFMFLLNFFNTTYLPPRRWRRQGTSGGCRGHHGLLALNFLRQQLSFKSSTSTAFSSSCCFQFSSWQTKARSKSRETPEHTSREARLLPTIFEELLACSFQPGSISCKVIAASTCHHTEDEFMPRN